MLQESIILISPSIDITIDREQHTTKRPTALRSSMEHSASIPSMERPIPPPSMERPIPPPSIEQPIPLPSIEQPIPLRDGEWGMGNMATTSRGAKTI